MRNVDPVSSWGHGGVGRHGSGSTHVRKLLVLNVFTPRTSLSHPLDEIHRLYKQIHATKYTRSWFLAANKTPGTFLFSNIVLPRVYKLGPCLSMIGDIFSSSLPQSADSNYVASVTSPASPLAEAVTSWPRPRQYPVVVNTSS